MSVGKYFYKVWLAVMLVALCVASLLTFLILDSYSKSRDNTSVSVQNKENIVVTKMDKDETGVSSVNVLYSELRDSLDTCNYTIVVRSKRDHIDSDGSYVTKPYDLVYTYTTNGTDEYWTQISDKNDKYGVNKYLGKISIAKRGNGVYTFSNFKKKSEYSSKNPYKFITFVEKDYTGEISDKEMKYISDILFQAIVDTSPIINKIDNFGENCKMTYKKDDCEIYQYEKNDTISNIEVCKENNKWIYRETPAYSSVSDLFYEYHIEFVI